MDIHTVDVLVSSLFDSTGSSRPPYAEPIPPGDHLHELLGLVNCDFDEVDRFYIDHETIGA